MRVVVAVLQEQELVALVAGVGGVMGKETVQNSMVVRELKP